VGDISGTAQSLCTGVCTETKYSKAQNKNQKEKEKETLCEKRVIYIPCVSPSLSVVCFATYGPKQRKKHLQTKSRIKNPEI
jgi:hypothetical protein